MSPLAKWEEQHGAPGELFPLGKLETIFVVYAVELFL